MTPLTGPVGPPVRRPRPPRRSPDGVWLRMLRALSGVTAAGMVVLAMVVTIAAWLATSGGSPGLGGRAMAGHWLVAGFAVLAQVVVVDRRWARPGVVALVAVGVHVLAVATVWVWWLA